MGSTTAPLRSGFAETSSSRRVLGSPFLRFSTFGWPPERPNVTWYDTPMPDEAEARNAERKLRAAARSARMTVEVVALGDVKPSPYEF